MPNLATCTREEVLDYFDSGWTLTELLLFSALQGEGAFRRAPYHRLRHPLVFYYAHPAAFYVNKLRVAGLWSESLDDELETLFQTGVDEMSWDDLSQTETDWPEVARVTEYRRRVYRIVRDVLERHPALADGHLPITVQSPRGPSSWGSSTSAFISSSRIVSKTARRLGPPVPTSKRVLSPKSFTSRRAYPGP